MRLLQDRRTRGNNVGVLADICRATAHVMHGNPGGAGGMLVGLHATAWKAYAEELQHPEVLDQQLYDSVLKAPLETVLAMERASGTASVGGVDTLGARGSGSGIGRALRELAAAAAAAAVGNDTGAEASGGGDRLHAAAAAEHSRAGRGQRKGSRRPTKPAAQAVEDVVAATAAAEQAMLELLQEEVCPSLSLIMMSEVV